MNNDNQELIMSAFKTQQSILDYVKDHRLEFNANGHWFNDSSKMMQMSEISFLDLIASSDLIGNGKKVIDAVEKHSKLDSFLSISKPSLLECPVCGDYLELESDGKTIRPNTPCLYPLGVVIEIELNVPSGKMVAKDDLRQWFDIYGDFNINTIVGVVKTTEHMAKIGCAHGFVGNSCPGIYQLSKSRFFIGTIGSYHGQRGKQIAGIDTDLWWYSIVDYDEFKRRANCEPKNIGAEVFDVKPGVYKFRYLKYDKTQPKPRNEYKEVFAEFLWVRSPDPVYDFDADRKSMNYTAGQIVHESMINYPTLYPNTPLGIRSAVSHIFCCIGSGGNWHENGFKLYNPETPADLPEINIPVFDDVYGWYPLSEYSALLQAAGLTKKYDKEDCEPVEHRLFLNDSFLSLAFNIARCIAVHGTRDSMITDESAKREASQKEQKIALACLKRLAEFYPDKVPDNCRTVLQRQ